jgi:hypothetical protein
MAAFPQFDDWARIEAVHNRRPTFLEIYKGPRGRCFGFWHAFGWYLISQWYWLKSRKERAKENYGRQLARYMLARADAEERARKTTAKISAEVEARVHARMAGLKCKSDAEIKLVRAVIESAIVKEMDAEFAADPEKFVASLGRDRGGLT